MNGVDLIGEQLDALSAQAFAGDWELIVADNGSTDGTVEYAKRWSDRLPIRVLEVPTGGACTARNAGVAVARHSKIAFLDHDDRAMPGWLAAMDSALSSLPLVGGRLNYADLNAPLIVGDRVQKPAMDDLPVYRGVAHAMSCNMGCQRKVFDAIAGFDPEFNGGAEDVDFFFRAHRVGFDVTFLRDAVVAYRLRPTLRLYLRQMYLYTLMDARLDAKYRRLGYIPRQSARSKAAAAWGHLKLLAGVNLLLTPTGRLQYAHRVGSSAGALVGFVRCGQFVL